MKNEKTKSKLDLRVETISNIEKVSGGKTTNISATVCDTAILISRFDDCDQPRK